jgi:membrane-associated HD superfamily phosphohydrolase
MPIMGTAIYFYITPRFLESELVKANLFAIGIVTIIMPIVLFFLLKSLGQVESIFLRDVKERKFPLMLQCILLLLIIKVVFNPYDNPELYYFFIGALFSAFAALIMVLFKIKVSLHQIGVAGVLMFLVGLSAHFKVNLLVSISFFLFVNGWVASSRLQKNDHTNSELVMGLFLGAIPQLILFNMWL